MMEKGTPREETEKIPSEKLKPLERETKRLERKLTQSSVPAKSSCDHLLLEEEIKRAENVA